MWTKTVVSDNQAPANRTFRDIPKCDRQREEYRVVAVQPDGQPDAAFLITGRGPVNPAKTVLISVPVTGTGGLPPYTRGFFETVD